MLKSNIIWNFMNKTDLQTLKLKTNKKTITEFNNFKKVITKKNI